MKKIKERFTITLIILGFCGLIYGIGYIKYKIWRAEWGNDEFYFIPTIHPQAKTWIFFVSRGK